MPSGRGRTSRPTSTPPRSERGEVPSTVAHNSATLCWTRSYSRRIDSCITRLEAQGPHGTCNESKEEEHALEICPKTEGCGGPLSSQCGTHKTVRARFWPCLSEKEGGAPSGAPIGLKLAPASLWGPYALTPNALELIWPLAALVPRGGPVQDPVLTACSRRCLRV